MWNVVFLEQGDFVACNSPCALCAVGNPRPLWACWSLHTATMPFNVSWTKSLTSLVLP